MYRVGGIVNKKFLLPIHVDLSLSTSIRETNSPLIFHLKMCVLFNAQLIIWNMQSLHVQWSI